MANEFYSPQKYPTSLRSEFSEARLQAIDVDGQTIQQEPSAGGSLFSGKILMKLHLRLLQGRRILFNLKLTAKAPENGWLKSYSYFLGRPTFRGELAVSFLEGISSAFDSTDKLDSRIKNACTPKPKKTVGSLFS